ncbi:helix-turn-helix transcriptional regulator [Cellulomonas sp. McL0617]|uniref:helix-turn-helix transcriptional regulator n=1 Tax=Cellulomonas sp. McL0617 TaxID=3415675 RepID=UPI003CEE2ADC
MPATPFVGRVEEITSLVGMLSDERATRLVTLTGIGGIGKTRLVAEVARRLREDGAGPVHVAELASLGDAELVVPAVAAAVGLTGLAATLDGVTQRLREVGGYVVLDNCEHLVDGVSEIAGVIVRECPGVRVIATSRIVLGRPEETVVPVPSLSLTTRDDEATPSEAALLFLDRASRARRGSLEGAALDDVRRIVEGLDGIPLAIELAAARMRVMSAREIADGLVDRLTILGGAPRHTSARHRSMRASLDLSLRLLDPEYRALFAELSVFADSFTLVAAGAVCERPVLDGLTELVDNSLLVIYAGDSTTRYHFPEFVRQYAEELLDPAEREVLRSRHRRVFLELAQRCDEENWAFSSEGHRRLAPEMPNVLRALDHAASVEHPDALTIVASLGNFWSRSGRFAEAALAARRALEATPDVPSPQRALAMERFSVASTARGDFVAGRKAAVAAVEMAEATGDARALAVAITREASQRCLVDPSGVLVPLGRAIGLAREAGDLVCLSDALLHVCMSAHLRTDLDALESALPEALRVTEGLNYAFNLRWILYTAGLSALWAGRIPEAQAYAARALAVDGGEDEYSRTAAHATQSIVDARTGRSSEALARASEQLAIVRREQLTMAEGGMLAAVAIASLAAGDPAAAERQLTAMDEGIPTLALRYERHHSYIAIGLCRGDADLVETHARALAGVAASAPSSRHAGIASVGLAEAALLRGETDYAERTAKAGLAVLAAAGWWLACVDALETLGAIAVEQGDPERAARYLGATSAVRDQHHLLRVPPAPARWAAVDRRGRDLAGDESYDRAWRDGQALSIGEAADYALRSRGPRRRPESGWPSLTPIERRVAELAAEGLTNPEIAARVFIARSTVKMHLSSVYAKLGVNGRVELAATAKDDTATWR